LTAPNGLAMGAVGAMKAQQALAARKLAKGWTDAMKEHQLAALCVNMQTGQNDAGGFLLGYLDMALEELGYLIAHMTVLPVGQNPDGVIIQSVSMLLKSKTGKAQSVILA
jgi:hypothetical protein